MGKIIRIDLTENKVTSIIKTYDFSCTGKSLATQLVMEHAKVECDYLSSDNYIAFVPGLLTGTQAPTTGRMTIATKKNGNEGIKSINLAGPLSQKMASLGIEAILVTGKSDEKNVVIHISEDTIEIKKIEGIDLLSIPLTIDKLKNEFGVNTSTIGIGPAGVNGIGLSSVFSTYPEGTPAYYCSRGGMGDALGHKGIKALCITSKKHFDSPLHDSTSFRKTSKEFARMIISNPVCGGALPAYGSITLIKMMKMGKKFDCVDQFDKGAQITEAPKLTDGNMNNKLRLNKTCSPNCVIGCLNRHSGASGDTYSSPAESEAVAAFSQLFKIENKKYISTFNKRCFEFGIDTIEFLFSCALLIACENEVVNEEVLSHYLVELENLSLKGRTLGSGTQMIFKLYGSPESLSHMVTKPSFVEESDFKVELPYKVDGCENMTDLEYLYAFMTLSGNMGLCLFSSFAILESPQGIDLLAKLVNSKCGTALSSKELLIGALNELNKQKAWQESLQNIKIASYIPEFVKVLYRYFGILKHEL